MKKAVLAAVIALSFSGCATTTKMYDTKVSYSGAPTVVIIGGANPEPMEALRNAFPGSLVVIPEKYYPLGSGADAVLAQIRRAGVQGRLMLIGHSWGGLLARTIDARNPGLIVAVVTIATPLDIRFMPTGLGDPFHPDDTNSGTPLYVIAGVKLGAEKKWWMMADESDGVVDVASAMNFAGREVKASAIFRGESAEHTAITGNPLVADQIRIWLGE